VLGSFARPSDPNLLVGFEYNDDAAVYKIPEGMAVVSTVDFITPVVDEPAWFGRVAAANSLSDVYAMGGRPVAALNLVMFPVKKLGTEVLKEVLRGGNEKVSEAGASLAGGHSVEDDEPKYGLAVIGVISPDRILTNRGVLPGDALILTKPLGTGVLFNAHRSKRLPWLELLQVLPQVADLNRQALEAALHFPVHACTDVSGFGLLGHALEMARGSGVRIEISFRDLPLYPNAVDMYRKGESTGSNPANRQLVQAELDVKAGLKEEQEEILFDPQNSGGLLLSVPSQEADSLVIALKKAGVTDACRIGEAVESNRPGLRVF
jgi:selenide, water dikinase